MDLDFLGRQSTKFRNFRNINIMQIIYYRLPLSGKLSLLHRISGALLFLSVPTVILPIFEASVNSEESYSYLMSYFKNFYIKLILLTIIWSYLHHFCAGIRYFLLDFHIGIDKIRAHKSAKLVFIFSLILTFIFGLKLFGIL
ncbi:MAG: succinate dehydrogenase, cytochrome b556 subunit [Bordetella sp.]|nr:MAG: succinate dehydrogenase, cytochrome b556 subunit [Bordetella sp.]